MFSPPSIPPARPSQWVFDVGQDEQLPWNAGHQLRNHRLRENQTWRHIVYVGVYPRESVFAALGSVFPPSGKDFEERPSGSSALLALAVSDEGVLLKDSTVLSACAWATARAHNPGPNSVDWLDGFADLEGEFARQLEEWLLDHEDGRGDIVLNWSALEACRGAAIEALGVEGVLSSTGIRVRSEIVAQRSADVVEHDFLNSFIADDLARVSGATSRGEAGPALIDYLRPTNDFDLGRRADVRTELDEVRCATNPDRVPLGRWPSSPDHPLALGQQLAVDEAVGMPGAGEHLFAVNGPPGTGKTTMLRGLIAALVTERAERLAALPNPSDAFIGEPHQWQTGDYRRLVHRLRPELTGFELVVASSNNGAVENVTLEIPSAGAIDPSWDEQAERVDYFPALAGRAMNGKQGDGGASEASGRAAWALVAARLGNRKNRRDFVNAVWWRTEPTAAAGSKGVRPPPLPGLFDILKAWDANPEGESWADAVAAFGQARDRVVSLQNDRLRAQEALDQLAELESKLENAHEAERAALERIVASRPRRDEFSAASRAQEDELRHFVEAREEHRQHRPWVIRFRARAEWRERDSQLGADIAAVEDLLGEIGDELRVLEEEEQAHAQVVALVAALKHALDECRQALSHYSEQPGARIPDDEWLQDRRERELQSPWTDPDWNQARTELFLAALSLHRAFLVHAARPMRQSLFGAMDIIGGKAPQDLPEDAVLAAWQVLFLLVPVVSTTFASVSRLFRGLGQEALGWLLVDEAGQAAPQNMVGALWRCQRAVVVGDPLQLEPITSVPFKAEQAIREHYNVDEQWLTGRESVQSLTDRLNRLGTTLPGAERSVWVGAPLTVHRRCDQPMFDLSNRIAYDGLMLHATDPTLEQRFAALYPTLPDSKWIDVRSSTSIGHWIPAEGAALEEILIHLKGIGFDFAKAIAITPFRDVAHRLRKYAGQYPGFRAGTIHTAQGKEADIVILVLGSEPARDGARSWAASKPNLLNVAVSRARRRLYVIGDRNAWMGHRYFDLLADRLPHGQVRT